MKFVVILLILLFSLIVRAQQSDSQLAYTYYQNKEYDKAAELFLQLYERTHASDFLNFHVICLINGKQYDKAENFLKKQLKTDASNTDFLINLGYIYEQQGKTAKSEEYYDKAIKKLIPQRGAITNLAYKFRNIREYSWAIKTYMRGRELLKQPDAFLSELGENYMLERNYERMLDLYIKTLELKPSEINIITSRLNFARSYDIINSVDAVIEKKLAALLSQPDYKPVFDELAVWYALQKKDYPRALQHASLLNQKEENKLNAFMNVAREAAHNKNYPAAIEAYQKVVSRGKENNSFFLNARKEVLNCTYQKSLQEKAGKEVFLQLARQYEEYIGEYGYTADHIDVTISLSDLYAYQLHLPDSANQVLARSIQIRRLSPYNQNLLKSKRADLLTFMDNPWEATILYTQIEKANPNNDIGYEAKLKKAWLAYYSADLLWAKAQFDVLKGATTKLISNDAIRMAHFINSNYDEEGDNADLKRLARAEYLIYRQQNQEAFNLLDSLLLSDKNNLADRAKLLKSRLLHQAGRDEEASALLEDLKDEAEMTSTRAEAIYELAQLKTGQHHLLEAQELYKLLVSEYSGSVYSVEAGRLYRENEKKLNTTASAP